MQQRQRLLHSEEQPFDVAVERVIKVFLSDCAKRSEFAAAGIRKDDVDAALLLLHNRVQPIKIREIRDIALNPCDVLADLLHRRIEFALTATGDKNICALCDESLCRGETDTAIPAGDDCNFSL